MLDDGSDLTRKKTNTAQLLTSPEWSDAQIVVSLRDANAAAGGQ
jgi:hypothetical protein